jgi:hypothetical protein
MASSFSRVLALLDEDDLLLLAHRFWDNQMPLSTLKDIDSNDLKKILGDPGDRYRSDIIVAKSSTQLGIYYLSVEFCQSSL